MLKSLHFKTILPVLFLLLTFTACKKYEEGPVTLRSPKARLTDKDWVLSERLVNGKAETLDDDDKAAVTTYEDDGKVTVAAEGLSFSGTWEFTEKKEKIKVTFAFFGQSVSNDVTILKLTNDELWTKYTEEGETIEEHYKKK